MPCGEIHFRWQEGVGRKLTEQHVGILRACIPQKPVFSIRIHKLGQ